MRTSPHIFRHLTCAVSDQVEKKISGASPAEEISTVGTMDRSYMLASYLSAAVDAPSNRSNGLR
jgi:hypothetical protein